MSLHTLSVIFIPQILIVAALLAGLITGSIPPDEPEEP